MKINILDFAGILNKKESEKLIKNIIELRKSSRDKIKGLIPFYKNEIIKKLNLN